MKKLVGILIILLSLVGIFYVLTMVSNVVAVISTTGMVVIGSTILLLAFVLFKTLKWCFT